MRKIILILFYIFLFLYSAIAQNDNSGRKKVIKWPKYYKAALPKDALVAAAIQVIPFQWDADHLGYVQVGLDNKNVSAVPSEPFSTYIQDYITKQYGEGFKPNGVHLLWVVKDLRINERTTFSAEHAFVRLKADAYASADGNTYRFVTSFDTVLRHGGMEVTSSHGQNMAAAFYLLLKRSLEMAPNAMAAKVADLTLHLIEEKEKQRFAIPILIASSYNDGVYTRFDEFLKNKPSIKAFDIALEGKKIKLYKMGGSEGETLSNAWGFCQGGEIFKYQDDEMIPIERMGNGFVISTYIRNINQRNKNQFNNALVSGAVGGLVGGAVAASSLPAGKIYNVTSIPYIIKKQPEACAIDMETGELTF